MKNVKTSILVCAALAVFSGGVQALEVDPVVVPEVTFGGRALVTGNYVATDLGTGGTDAQGELDVSDSALLFSFSKYLFTDVDYGFATIGFEVPEDDTELDDDIFFHQLQVGIGGPSSELILGRTRLPANTLIQFPTIRDDDLLDFTHVGNGFSNRDAEEDVIFGGQIRGTLYFPKIYVSTLAAITARIETDITNLANKNRKTGSDLNGLSLALAYDVPEAIKFDRGVRFAGLALDIQRVDEFSGSGTEEMATLVAGLTHNLSDNPERSWAVDVQLIYNFGVTVPDLGAIVSRARAESIAAVLALRHTRRPFLQTRWQAALIVAFKDHRGFDDASAVAVVPSFLYRLGSGVNFVAQYRFIGNGSTLASGASLDTSHAVFLGLSFAFDTTFNESVGERGAILNLEHDMLDSGPIGGGH